MSESILNSIKADLGLAADYDVFDPTVIRHINSALGTANQLGVGPPQGFKIEGETTTWAELLGSAENLEDIKAYIYLKVRMLFDPPSTSFHLDAIKEQIRELEWRLNVKIEEEQWTKPS